MHVEHDGAVNCADRFWANPIARECLQRRRYVASAALAGSCSIPASTARFRLPRSVEGRGCSRPGAAQGSRHVASRVWAAHGGRAPSSPPTPAVRRPERSSKLRKALPHHVDGAVRGRRRVSRRGCGRSAGVPAARGATSARRAARYRRRAARCSQRGAALQRRGSADARDRPQPSAPWCSRGVPPPRRRVPASRIISYSGRRRSATSGDEARWTASVLHVAIQYAPGRWISRV